MAHLFRTRLALFGLCIGLALTLIVAPESSAAAMSTSKYGTTTRNGTLDTQAASQSDAQFASPSYPRCSEATEYWTMTYRATEWFQEIERPLAYVTARFPVCWDGYKVWPNGTATFDVTNVAPGFSFIRYVSQSQMYGQPSYTSTRATTDIIFTLPPSGITSISVSSLKGGGGISWTPSTGNVAINLAMNVDTSGCYIYTGGGYVKHCL